MAKNNIEKLELERERLNKLNEFENKYKDFIVAGIDEAGRGPLAGPVVAACVVLDRNSEILYLDDSKKLSDKKRELLYDEIINKSLAYGVGIVNEKTIDEINILEATHVAMKEAYENANKSYLSKYNKNIEVLFVDALKIKNVDIKQVSIVHGDALSVSIAAASIIAKVTRDRLMIEYDKTYPQYGFKKHKGYGTKVHMDALKSIGPCEIHRKSFLSFLNGK
ncbi:MAG: ribonuclease HII [Lachnospiraceae bacterium]|nr:ribonuclease HII [Lachnospiraceae bacterium]